MAQRGRPGMSVAQKHTLWAAVRQGATYSTVARALGTHAACVQAIVARAGGFAPPPRRRATTGLTSAEREAISRGVAAGRSCRAIAGALGRAPSTISREIARNAGRHAYRALDAEEQAWVRARRPKVCRLAADGALARIVAAQLAADWSPQQIAGWLVTEYPDDVGMRVSHETIYRTLFVQARGALKRELTAHLRTRRTHRRSKQATRTGQGRGQIVDAVSIAERPPSVEDRAVPGHWEGDLLAGARHTYIATLVERRSRYVHLVRVTGKDTTTVVSALIREVQQLPAGLMQSLTWDRGHELAQHHRFSVATDVAVYFCDPKSPWQRGTNENTNGLLRQYFPDGTDLAPYTQRRLDQIALKLNTRPRKTLGYRTPAAILAEGVAPID